MWPELRGCPMPGVKYKLEGKITVAITARAKKPRTTLIRDRGYGPAYVELMRANYRRWAADGDPMYVEIVKQIDRAKARVNASGDTLH
jgi:hypothetical protein